MFRCPNVKMFRHTGLSTTTDTQMENYKSVAFWDYIYSFIEIYARMSIEYQSDETVDTTSF